MMIFKNKYGELRSGWAIAAVILVLLIGQMSSAALVPEGIEETIGLKIGITLLYSLITIAGGLLLFKCLYKRNLRQIGLIREGWLPELLHGAAMGVVSMGLVFIVLILTGQANISAVNISKLLSLNIIVELFSVSVFAFSEELLARGFFMTALKTTRNKWVIFLSSSILFSLLHLLNDGVTVLSFTNTLLAGLLFAYMFVKSGKLWLCTGFHIMWNFLQGDIFGMSVSGGEAIGVFDTEMGINQFLTGGSYGPEGGILVTIVFLLGFVYVYFIVKPPKQPAWTMTSDLPLTQTTNKH